MKRRLLVVSAALLALLAFTASAGAATLGITSAPSGATRGTDTGAVLGQLADTAGTPFIVPAGGGQITQWQTVSTNDVAGSSLTFLILRPTGGSYTVIATDTETIPNPLPASGVASFTLAHPVTVQGGDTLGLYTASGVSNVLYYYGTSVPAGENVFAQAATATPTVGQTISTQETGSGIPYEVNVGATLVANEDASVQTSAYPSVAEVGSPALLSSTVSNAGPSTLPLTFTEALPSGVQVQSASADYGTCTVSGQTVSCTLAPAAGQGATVDVIVTPSQAGSFAITSNVATAAAVPDPNLANNTVTATLTVAALPPKCIVPPLTKLPLTSARSILTALGCTLQTSTQHSSLAKGLVISSQQAPGTYPLHQLVSLVVSSGPKKPKKHRKHRKH